MDTPSHRYKNLPNYEVLLLTEMAHITTMVDESSKVSIVSGVNDVVMVHAEEITAANASCLIASFPLVCYWLSNHLPHILNDHLICSNGLHGKETPVVDGGL